MATKNGTKPLTRIDNPPGESRPLCFVIIPFRSEFAEIERLVFETAREWGLDPCRGDWSADSGDAVKQIQQAMRQSAIAIVAAHHQCGVKGTPPNANVAYELGFAHEVLGSERVVVLMEQGTETFYDIRGQRYLRYDPTQVDDSGFKEQLQRFIRRAYSVYVEEESWCVVRGPVARTQLIVRDLKNAVERAANERPVSQLIIRTISGLGSIAISDLEQDERRYEPEYVELLREERRAVLHAVSQGAKLRSLMIPPRRVANEELPERLKIRYRRLIGLMEGKSDSLTRSDKQLDQQAMQAMMTNRCEFALTSVPSPNLFIIGNQVAYEGFKRGHSPGFARTHRETNPQAIAQWIAQFDDLFLQCESDTKRREPVDGGVLQQLKHCYELVMQSPANVDNANPAT
ncbi:MAG: nucleotide-binding protein, partial [Planctomycetaceae bacterium]|nr:nucleotide-binding protein [Planctomycetaceae bacterium]